ncbi:MAG: hypothetical protein S4CHLAM6_06070 [Chlamydiae bacterium]|nr:hypothetical protein [Chlamydiota bacterium]
MRKFFIFTLLVASSFLFAEEQIHGPDNQPGLIESLEKFFEKNGGELKSLGLEKEKEPIAEVQEAVKGLLEDLSQEEPEKGL